MSSLITPRILAVVLIFQLGSPSYHQRQRATKSLRQLAPLILPYLEEAKKHPDQEIAKRCNRILTLYYYNAADALTKEARPTGWSRLPWIDMLPQSHPNRSAIIEYYLDQARGKIGRKGPPVWDDYRLATQLYLRQRFQQRMKMNEATNLLDEMACKERDWIIQNGKNYSPPLQVPVASGK